MNLKSVTGKNWFFKKYNESYAKKISEKFNLDNNLSKFLSIKKIELEKINDFLNPTIKNNLPNPFSIKDMDKGINSLLPHLNKKNNIGIFGDYDVDGATSSALLINYFKQIRQPFEFFIPDRIKNGYGPSIEGFNFLIDKGCKIILTVDCGTSAYKTILFGKKKNVKTIVLDHHQGNITLPMAAAIVNPNRIDDESNLKYLSAVS